ITSISLLSSDFLEFNRFIAPSIFYYHLLTLLLQFGIIIALFTNIFRIIQLSRMSIADVDNTIVEERKIPFWRRKYLDILLLGFGSLFYIITVFSSQFQLSLPPEFLLIFSLPSPLFIIVGSVMLTSRLFSIITNIIGTYIWEHQGSLISFSLKNTAKHKHSATRALILVSLTLAFGISFLIFPFSFVSYGEATTHYQIGSELTVSMGYGEYNNTFEEYLLKNFSTQIQAYSPVMSASLEYYQIMIINPKTFLQAAWMREDFAPNLNNDMKNLEENGTILMLHQNMVDLDKNIGQNISWTNLNTNQGYIYDVNGNQIIRNYSSHDFKVVGEFSYWPKLVSSYSNYYPSTFTGYHPLVGVMSFNTYNNMKKQMGNESQYAIRSGTDYIYIKPKSDLNQTNFSLTLKKISGVQVSSYQEQINAFKTNPLYLVIIGQINSNVIYSILIIIIILGMSGFKQLVERSKEIATERAVGMTLSQTFIVFLSETLWLVVFSITIGIIFGVVFSSLFLYGLTNGPTIPPFAMVYPWNLISIVIILLLTSAIILSFIPAYFSSKLEINKLLKVE
ncbi:MAG: FtsX-like permease family protein, partial [Candidatus Thorarchaeota archaeon]